MFFSSVQSVSTKDSATKSTIR